MGSCWGNYPKHKAHSFLNINWRDENIPFDQYENTFLAHGQGKSYGDSCLNENGVLVFTKNLNRLINFNAEKGILECEAGITFAEILAFIVPKKWFLPVLAGTKYISMGGAIANDIHGKNHFCAGTIGNHVLSFWLLRSNGDRIHCSSHSNPKLYEATIGGLGLTGIILSVEIQLIPITTTFLEVEFIQFKNIENFLQIANESKTKFNYTVAWLDCITNGKNFSRGIFMRANPVQKDTFQPAISSNNLFSLSLPCYFPNYFLNRYVIKILNELYYYKIAFKQKMETFYDKFFFPLDAIQNWNRMYGRSGFLQYQCVLPLIHAIHIQKILKRIVSAGQGSFLSVLKTFGHTVSPGLLSFPLQGVTLAIDFPYHGIKTLKLLEQLDDIVMEYSGRVYPAKDARMSSKAFKFFYPKWEEFLTYVDPKFSSSFWRRIMKNEP